MTYLTDPNAFLTDLQFFGCALAILACLLCAESLCGWLVSKYKASWWVAVISGWTVWKRGSGRSTD